MRTVPKEIRQEVNHLAHNLAMKHEAEVRDTLLAELEEDADSGATLADMRQKLRRYQQGPDLR